MGDNQIEKRIFINKASYDALIEYCLGDPLREACGIFAGKDRKIEKIFPLTNISDNQKFCYLIDPKEQLAVFKEVRRLGLECLAIFHSHVDSQAYPSKRDVELAFYPETSYIIVSLNASQLPVVRSFRIVEGNINEEELVVVD